MTAMPQAIALAHEIEAEFAKTPHVGTVGIMKALTVARALLAIAAPGQSATDAARALVKQLGENGADFLSETNAEEPIAQAIAAFAAAQVAAETERCAKVADDLADSLKSQESRAMKCARDAALDIADAIRARQAP